MLAEIKGGPSLWIDGAAGAKAQGIWRAGSDSVIVLAGRREGCRVQTTVILADSKTLRARTLAGCAPYRVAANGGSVSMRVSSRLYTVRDDTIIDTFLPVRQAGLARPGPDAGGQAGESALPLPPQAPNATPEAPSAAPDARAESLPSISQAVGDEVVPPAISATSPPAPPSVMLAP